MDALVSLLLRRTDFERQSPTVTRSGRRESRPLSLGLAVDRSGAAPLRALCARNTRNTIDRMIGDETVYSE